MSQPKIDIFRYFNELHTQSAIQVQLLVLTKDFQLYRANTESRMNDDLIDCFLTPTVGFVNSDPDYGLTIEEYDPQLKPDNPVLWYIEGDAVPSYQLLKDSLKESPDDLEPFNNDNNAIENVKAVGLRVFKDDGNDLFIFQHIAQNYILKNSKKLGIYFDGSSFGKIEQEANFQISKSNDLFCINDEIFVLKSGSFETIFNYIEKKRAVADTKLMQIESKYSPLISLGKGLSLAELLEGDKSAMNKLQKLDGNVQLDNQKLQQQIKDYKLDVQLNESGKLEINSKKDAKTFLSILNNDNLSSTLNGDKFTVHSKKKIKF